MRESLIKRLNKIFWEDPYILSLLNAHGIELDTLEALAEKIYNNMFFDTMDEDIGIPIYAKTLNLSLKETLRVEEKRSIIEAKWKSKGKCTEELIQNICNSWRNGEVLVDFIDEEITVHFNNIGGVPTDLDALKKTLDTVKPAYLLVNYVFNWLYWDMFDSWDLTWDEFDSANLTWDELEATIFSPI